MKEGEGGKNWLKTLMAGGIHERTYLDETNRRRKAGSMEVCNVLRKFRRGLGRTDAGGTRMSIIYIVSCFKVLVNGSLSTGLKTVNNCLLRMVVCATGIVVAQLSPMHVTST